MFKPALHLIQDCPTSDHPIKLGTVCTYYTKLSQYGTLQSIIAWRTCLYRTLTVLSSEALARVLLSLVLMTICIT